MTIEYSVLSQVSVDEVFGMLLVVRRYVGWADMAELSENTRVDFDKLLQILEAGEEFGLVERRGKMVRLTALGKHFLTSSVHDRRRILRALFENDDSMRCLLRLAENGDETLLEEHVQGTQLARLVEWARYVAVEESPAEELRQASSF